MKKLNTELIPLIIIVFFGLFLQYKFLNEFPSHIHAWSQSDRYAIALGFERNNLNFFKPETYVMNHQFPDDFKKPHQTSITSVDFPIHDYIPAVIMKIFGNKSPIFFRLYTLLFSFLGLFFLFRLSLFFNKNINLSFLVVLLVATSPVYVYYQSGFIPTIPCISLSIMGIYYYFLYFQGRKTIAYSLGFMFLTLAALSRSTFIIPLIAFGAFDILLTLFEKQDKKTIITKGIILILCSSVFIGYFLYNSYLRNKFGSIFLNELLPASSFSEAKEILKSIKDKWKWHYFSKWHYLIFALLFISSLAAFIWGKFKSSKSQYALMICLMIYSIGSLSFILAMLKQFSAHDYYFLDSLFIPAILFLILLTSYLKLSKKSGYVLLSIVVLVAISLPLIINAKKMQETRRETGSWDRTNSTISNFEYADKFLDSLNISKNAKILVLDAYAPNIPFIKMNRKGYAVLTTSRENIVQSLTWDFDYIAIQNEFFISDIFNNYPEIVTRIEKIGDNGKISICKLATGNNDLYDFLELSTKKPLFQESLAFDSIPNPEWSNVNIGSETVKSTNKFSLIEPTNEFGLTFKSSKMTFLKEKGHIFNVSCRIFNPELLKSCEAVCSIHQDGKNMYYYTFILANFIKSKNNWKTIMLTYYLPPVTSDNYEFAWYFWNKEKEVLRIDDVQISVYE